MSDPPFPTLEPCSVCDDLANVYCNDCAEYLCTNNDCDAEMHKSAKLSAHKRVYNDATATATVPPSPSVSTHTDISSAPSAVQPPTPTAQPPSTLPPPPVPQPPPPVQLVQPVIPALTSLSLTHSPIPSVASSRPSTARSTQSQRDRLADIVADDLHTARRTAASLSAQSSLASIGRSSGYNPSVAISPPISSRPSTRPQTAQSARPAHSHQDRQQQPPPPLQPGQHIPVDRNQWLHATYNGVKVKRVQSARRSNQNNQPIMSTISTRPVTAHIRQTYEQQSQNTHPSGRAQSARPQYVHPVPPRPHSAAPVRQQFMVQQYEPVQSHIITHKSHTQQLNEQLRNNIAYLGNVSASIDKQYVVLDKLKQNIQSEVSKMSQSTQRIESALLVVKQRNDLRVDAANNPVLAHTMHTLVYDQQLEQSLFTEYQCYHGMLEQIDNVTADSDGYVHQIDSVVQQLRQQQGQAHHLLSIDQRCLRMDVSTATGDNALVPPSGLPYDPPMLQSLIDTVPELRQHTTTYIKLLNELYDDVSVQLREHRRKTGFAVRQCHQHANEQRQAVLANGPSSTRTAHIAKHISQLQSERLAHMNALQVCEARHRLRHDSMPQVGIHDSMIQQLVDEMDHIHRAVNDIDVRMMELRRQIDAVEVDGVQHQQMLNEAITVADFYDALITLDPIEHNGSGNRKTGTGVVKTNAYTTAQAERMNKQLLRRECALMERLAVKARQVKVRQTKKQWQVTSKMHENDYLQANIDEYMYLNSR